MKLLWLDLETTGLDHSTERILAIGMRLTDFSLMPLGGTFEEAVAVPDWVLRSMHPVVREMHTKSGLLVKAKQARDRYFVEESARSFVRDSGAGRGDTYLAGNSIHFDRAFLARGMPSILEFVHHRMVDVSTLKVLAQAWAPEAAKPQLERVPVHTPLADIDASIAELKHWRDVLFKAGIGLGPLAG